jgi:hypothetical protein
MGTAIALQGLIVCYEGLQSIGALQEGLVFAKGLLSVRPCACLLRHVVADLVVGLVVSCLNGF